MVIFGLFWLSFQFYPSLLNHQFRNINFVIGNAIAERKASENQNNFFSDEFKRWIKLGEARFVSVCKSRPSFLQVALFETPKYFENPVTGSGRFNKGILTSANHTFGRDLSKVDNKEDLFVNVRVIWHSRIFFADNTFRSVNGKF